MKNILFCCLLFPLVVACKKQSAVNISPLPEPDSAILDKSYPVVTAATVISLDSATVYRLGLAPYASFYKFDRSMKNGNLYYDAILESAKQFKPLKFYILNNGTGTISAVATPSTTEVAAFNEEWNR